MKKKQIAATLGIMCFILTMAIVVQIKTMNSANLAAKQTLTDNELRDEVLKWKEKYDNTYAELEKKEKELETVRTSATQNNETASAKEKELKQNNLLLGVTNVKGNGLEITLQDNNVKSSDSTIGAIVNPAESIVHYNDLLSVINELNNAGAEAIEINGQRIILTSAITCEGNVIKVNGQKIGSPFTIKAIGSQSLLYGQLTRRGSYLEIMEDDGVLVEVKEVENIEIEKYTGVVSFKYLKVSD